MQQDKANERTDAQASQLLILLTLAYVLRESCAPALQPQHISAQCYLSYETHSLYFMPQRNFHGQEARSHDSLQRRVYFLCRAMNAGEPTSKNSEISSMCDIAALVV